MSAVQVAYSLLRWEARGVSLEFVHSDRVREQKLIVSSGQAALNPDKHAQLVRVASDAFEALRTDLGVERITKEIIAYSCPTEWKTRIEDAQRTAMAKLNLDVELFEADAAEAICFFEFWEGKLKPICRALFEECQGTPTILEGTTVTLAELGASLNALETRTMKVAVVGTMKAGKSTFLNALLGQFVMPALDKRCTRRRFVLYNNNKGKRSRCVWVLRLGKNGSQLDPRFNVDADLLGWNSDQLRSYLFALNAPGLLQRKPSELDQLEGQMLDEYQKLPFETNEQRDAVKAALSDSTAPIEAILLAHPFWGLPFDRVGNVEVWDTPGPDGINEIGEEIGIRHTDSQAFEYALRESSAVIVLFDVMKRESAAQDEVLQRIAEHRRNRPRSIVMLANKVDQRSVRNVEPLDSLLTTIQKEVRERHGLPLGPVLPISSRPAQLAREILNARKTHEAVSPGLKEEYEAVERSSDRAADGECPERAVEKRSRIIDVEILLGRFFREEHGRSILHGVVGKALTIFVHRQNNAQLRLAGLGAEQEQLDHAKAAFEEGARGLRSVLGSEKDRLDREYKKAVSAGETAVNDCNGKCKNEVEEVLRSKFPNRSLIEGSQLPAFHDEVLKSTDALLSNLRASLVDIAETNLANDAHKSWKVVADCLQDIERKVGRSLGIELETLAFESKPDFSFLKTSDGPTVPTQKDSEHVHIAKGAGWGAVFGAAVAGVGIVGALIAGPPGWLGLGAVLAGGVAAGAGAGAGYGYVKGDVVVTETVQRETVLSVWKKHLDDSFGSIKSKLAEEQARYFEQIRGGVEARASEKISHLERLLAECSKQAGDSTRASNISRLNKELDRIGSNLPDLREAAERLGLKE